MKNFFLKISLFIAFSIIPFLIFWGAFMLINNYNFSHIPAINFSNSYSFNEKMMFLRNNTKSYEVMAIGSSMALNNLHSETIIERLDTESYINMGSWGLNNEEIYNFLKIVYPTIKPTTIIFPGNMYDFMESRKTFRNWTITSFLRKSYPKPLYYLATFDLKYYVENFSFAKSVRNYPHNYDYLEFDKFGAVNFYSKTFDIDSLRYNSRIIDEIVIDEMQYAYLDSIVSFCEAHDIKFIYSDMPLRGDLQNTLTEEELEIFVRHASKIDEVVQNHTYIKSGNFDLKDSMYYDNTHLNATGAQIFTEKIFSSIQ